MKVLVTGGAGFIGRWVVKRFLDEGHEVVALDNFSNGRPENILEFRNNEKFGFVEGDILDKELLGNLFSKKFDTCIHLAAQIDVQNSIDDPRKSFLANVVGTYSVLELSRLNKTKLVLAGTCMVYDLADSSKPISESHPIKPASPYASTKLAAEELAISFYYAYKHPVVIVRPFNTYGPFQKTNMEGGVVGIFISKALRGEKLRIFGDGKQTRDLLYVEDCADFIFKASTTGQAIGETINAGTGRDISINELAFEISGDEGMIEHVKHHHPQAEIQKLVCDSAKARALLNWEPKTSLREGIAKTTEWIKANGFSA
jgi:UDP-glucose 4-epimerase